MQTKLLIASLAALSHAADFESGVERQAKRDEILSFIKDIIDCDVDIGQIEYSYATRSGDLLDHYVEFTLKGFEKCPGLRVEAWVEDHNDEETLKQEFKPKKTWSPEEVHAINYRMGGASTFKYTRQTSAGGGEYKAHITIWDANNDVDAAEWTMPLLVHCEEKIVPIRCPSFSMLDSWLSIDYNSPETVTQLVSF